MKKESGILMHIANLPNNYGIGSFGKECYDFVDYLVKAKMKYWQVLPLNQTGYSNSPYMSEASESISPYFINPEILFNEKLITKAELISQKETDIYIDYGKLYEKRYPVLRKAFERFDKNNEDFIKFVKKGKYKNYALFMALKHKFDFKAFYSWEDGYKFRDKKILSDFVKQNKNEILFWNFLQYKCFEQWTMVKGYANKCGVKIIGDMPLYVAYDSVDVWENPQVFQLDERLNLKKVAGVPPDYFSSEGQLWGNPVYDYEKLSKNNFAWWIERLKSALKKFNLVRIDHFRGLDRYYQIPYGSPDAKNGEWVKVPSDALFGAIKKSVNVKNIIAEDLGILDEGVYKLLEKTNLPGMCVLSFAFNGEKDNKYLPYNIDYNSICYTGTHDNDTLMGLLNSLSDWDKKNMIDGVKTSIDYFNIKNKLKTEKDIARAIIETGFASKAKIFIIPMQDVLLLGSEYRMNEPSTFKSQNWSIKFSKKQINESSATYLKKMNIKYNR